MASKNKGKKGARRKGGFFVRRKSSGGASAAPVVSAARPSSRRRRWGGGVDRGKAAVATGVVAGVAAGSLLPLVHRKMDEKGFDPAIQATKGVVGKIALGATIASLVTIGYGRGPVATGAAVSLACLASADQALCIARR